MGFFTLLYCQCPCCIAQSRFIIAVFAICGSLMCYCQRASLNVGIVEMVDHKDKNSTCPSDASATHIENIEGGKVSWSELEQGLILAAFFGGYLVSHVPAGICCDIYGPRYPLLIGFVLSTITTGLIPLGTDYWWIVFILRFGTGLGQGGLFPGLSALIAHWIPPHERTSVGAAVFAATSFGLVFGQVGTAWLIHTLESWPIVFYIWCGIGVLYCLLALVYVFSDPRTHPYIHDSELNYLKAIMVMHQHAKIPWKHMLLDKCVWGVIFVQLGHDLIIFTLANNFPKYLNEVLGLPILENGLVSFIYLLLWIGGTLAGTIADYAIKKKNANVTLMRVLYTGVSNLMAFIFFMIAILVECRVYWSIACFACALFFKGIFFAGGKVHIVDISVNHPGLLMAYINGVGAIVGFISPYAIGSIVKNQTFEEWRIIGYGIGVFEVVTFILYVFMSKARRSDWDYADGEEKQPPSVSWKNELSPADHEKRVERDKAAAAERAAKAKEAKAAMKRT